MTINNVNIYGIMHRDTARFISLSGVVAWVDFNKAKRAFDKSQGYFAALDRKYVNQGEYVIVELTSVYKTWIGM